MAARQGDLARRILRELDQIPGADSVVPVVQVGRTREADNPDQQRRASYEPVVGQGGQQTLAPGDSETWGFKQGVVAAAVDFSIPTDVTATLRWNDDEKLGVNDGGGRSGRIEAPSGFVFVIDTIELEATNNGTEDADLFCAVVVPR